MVLAVRSGTEFNAVAAAEWAMATEPTMAASILSWQRDGDVLLAVLDLPGAEADSVRAWCHLRELLRAIESDSTTQQNF